MRNTSNYNPIITKFIGCSWLVEHDDGDITGNLTRIFLYVLVGLLTLNYRMLHNFNNTAIPSKLLRDTGYTTSWCVRLDGWNTAGRVG